MGFIAGWPLRRLRKHVFVLSTSASLVWVQGKSKVLHNYDGCQPDYKNDSRSDEKEDISHPTWFEDDEDVAWASLSARLLEANSSLAKTRWSSIGDAIANKIIPEWVKVIPSYIAKLQNEMEMHPGSLADEIWQEARNPFAHPEITFDSRVRIGKGLCEEELAFVQRRKRHTIPALARYLEIPETDIDPKDVPTIAICGSGGGLRALVAGASSCLSAQQSGLFDCATFTAGVSGSCWLQTLYNSSLGGRRHEKIIEHLKNRINTHFAYPPTFLELLTRAPTNKYVLSGTIEKLKGDPMAGFGLVDIYSILLATRLMIPRDELSIDDRDLKLSNQQKFLEQGENPMPIYTAVRHEIPIDEVRKYSNTTNDAVDAITQEANRKSRFQWFEFTPYELGCEELEAAIPSWSIGRHYREGRSEAMKDGFGLPELRIPFLMGIWGSAFCATLAHYYKEIRPLFKDLAGFGGVDDLIEGQKDELTKLHPVDPGQVPNYVLGLEDLLPASCPESIFKDPYMNLMDAGMSNNLPIYPLLRQGRDVDIIVCFDASADIAQENWLSRVDDYVKQQGITGWPTGAGWPNEEAGIYLTAGESDTEALTAEHEALGGNGAREEQHRGKILPNPPAKQAPQSRVNTQSNSNLGFCNIWVGGDAPGLIDEDPPRSKRLCSGEEWRLLKPDSGITVIYLPFLPNPKVEGVDPSTSAFMSTWNFLYSSEEIDKVVALAKANFDEGEEQIKMAVKAVYRRKKIRRLEMEEKDKIERWKRKLRNHGDHFS